MTAVNLLIGLGWACFVASLGVVGWVFFKGRTLDSDFWFRALAWTGFNCYVMAAVLALGGV